MELGFYDSAPLSCNVLCRYNVSFCKGWCGDAMINGPELCDGEVPRETCVDQGFDAGALGCELCGFDQMDCQRIGWRPIGLTARGNSIIDVSGTGPDDQWAVTNDKEILHSTGGAWTMIVIELSNMLLYSSTVSLFGVCEPGRN